MEGDNKQAFWLALLIAGAMTFAASSVYSSDGSSWSRVISDHWPDLLGTATVVFVAVFLVVRMGALVGDMLAYSLDWIFGFVTPIRFGILLVVSGLGYYYYQSIPQTLAECVASEMRSMGQGTTAAGHVAVVICKERGF